MNGDDFLRKVHQSHPDIRAIMVSGRLAHESIELLERENGFPGFLSKPFAPIDFYALIDGLVKEG